jgi:DNA-binding HxlR family transcriptional regulator
VLGDRWTPLVIRELMVGAGGFNEIHRGIPRISRTLLAQRLRLLERRGLVCRSAGPDGRPGPYTLTPAGEGLTPIIWAMGHWAAEWTFGDPEDEDCDGLSLMWRLHQHAITAKLPQQRTVLHMTLTGAGAAEGWLNIDRGAITVCKDNPGYDVDLAMHRPDAAVAGRPGPVPGPGGQRPRPPARAQPAGPGLPDLVRHVLLRRRPTPGRATPPTGRRARLTPDRVREYVSETGMRSMTSVERRCLRN